jgi:tRNA (guanine10-N2)-dimethyltransferase
MQVFFFLSGEHRTLPRAEVLAVFESLGLNYRVIDSFDQVLALETRDIDGVSERLSLTHRICQLQGLCDVEWNSIIRLLEAWDIPLTGSFCVRIRRIKEYGREIKTDLLEKKAGEILRVKTSNEVDLRSPDEVVYGIISEKFILGKSIHVVDRSAYEARRPHLRPFFRPGSMLPRIARAIVNLTRVKKGYKFLDPFCGTGGFLIEAGLIGAKVFGFDVDSIAVEGCRQNLEYYGIGDYYLETQDARNLVDRYSNYFDAIATDIPYGISSSTKKLSLEDLSQKAMAVIYEVLKEGGHACVVSPENVDIEIMAKRVGFKLREVHFQRVHRSLTRRITVLKK